MEKERNTTLMKELYLKENILMEKKMAMLQNMSIMEN